MFAVIYGNRYKIRTLCIEGLGFYILYYESFLQEAVEHWLILGKSVGMQLNIAMMTWCAYHLVLVCQVLVNSPPGCGK